MYIEYYPLKRADKSKPGWYVIIDFGTKELGRAEKFIGEENFLTWLHDQGDPKSGFESELMPPVVPQDVATQENRA